MSRIWGAALVSAALISMVCAACGPSGLLPMEVQTGALDGVSECSPNRTCPEADGGGATCVALPDSTFRCMTLDAACRSVKCPGGSKCTPLPTDPPEVACVAIRPCPLRSAKR